MSRGLIEPQQLGAFLREMRTAQKLSLGKLAAQAGLGKGTISGWESGQHLPRIPEMTVLLNAVQATPLQRTQALLLLDAPRSYRRLRDEQPDLAQVEKEIGAMPDLGELLRALRSRRGLPLEALASQMRVSPSTLSRWERGQLVPSAAQQETLLRLLHASPDERMALADFSRQRRTHPGPAGGAEVTEITLEAARYQLFLLQGVDNTTLELGCLALERAVWPLAARSASGREVLGEIYATHADVLSIHTRWREMQKYAERAQQLLGSGSAASPRTRHFWFTAFLASAQALVHAGRHPAPGRGLGMLQSGVSVSALSAHDRAWLHSRIAQYLALDGAMEPGVAMAARAVDIARHDDSEGNYAWRVLDLAALLSSAGRAGDAFHLLASQKLRQPVMQARAQAMQVKYLVALGQRAEAHDLLGHLNRKIEEHGFADLRDSADSLARLF